MFYHCYRIDREGFTLGLQNFQASNDDDAWLIADKAQANGSWYAFKLWEGLRQLQRPGEPLD